MMPIKNKDDPMQNNWVVNLHQPFKPLIKEEMPSVDDLPPFITATTRLLLPYLTDHINSKLVPQVFRACAFFIYHEAMGHHQHLGPAIPHLWICSNAPWVGQWCGAGSIRSFSNTMAFLSDVGTGILERFCHTPYTLGGVFLDRETGNYYRLRKKRFAIITGCNFDKALEEARNSNIQE